MVLTEIVVLAVAVVMSVVLMVLLLVPVPQPVLAEMVPVFETALMKAAQGMMKIYFELGPRI